MWRWPTFDSSHLDHSTSQLQVTVIRGHGHQIMSQRHKSDNDRIVLKIYLCIDLISPVPHTVLLTLLLMLIYISIQVTQRWPSNICKSWITMTKQLCPDKPMERYTSLFSTPIQHTSLVGCACLCAWQSACNGLMLNKLLYVIAWWSTYVVPWWSTTIYLIVIKSIIPTTLAVRHHWKGNFVHFNARELKKKNFILD